MGKLRVVSDDERPPGPSAGDEPEVHHACGVAHKLNEDCHVPLDSPRGMLQRALFSTSTDPVRALDRITAIDELRRRLEEEEKMAVIGARRARCTWTEIGAAIGTSRQGAFNRWGDMVRRFENAGLLDDVEADEGGGQDA